MIDVLPRMACVALPAAAVLCGATMMDDWSLASTSAAAKAADAGRDWLTLKERTDASILSSDVAGGFVGTYLGMFARTRNGSP